MIKITTGEELLGYEAPNQKAGTVSIEKPFQLLVIPQEDGTHNIAIIPYQIYSSGHDLLEVPDAHILYKLTPKEELLKVYQQRTTKIMLPKTSSLLLP